MALPKPMAFFKLRLLLLLLPFLAMAHAAQAQSIGVQGALCEDNELQIYLSASGPVSNVSWSVSGSGWTFSRYGDDTKRVIIGTCTYSGGLQMNVSYTDGYTGAFKSANKQVMINAIKTPSVSIASSVSGTVCQGTITRFTATPVNGGTSPVYNWYVNGVSQSGSNNAVFQPTGLAPGSYQVYVKMTSNEPCVTGGIYTKQSNSAYFTIKAREQMDPVVTLFHPGSGVIYHGCKASFSARVGNAAGTLSYRWFKNDVLVSADQMAKPEWEQPQVLALKEYYGERIHCEVSTNAFCYEQRVPSNTVAVPTSTRPVFTASIDGVSRDLCKNQTVVYTARASMPGAAFVWTQGGRMVTGSTFTTTATSGADLNKISLSASVIDPCGDGQQTISASTNLGGVPYNIVETPTVPVISQSQPLLTGYKTSVTLTAGGAGANEVYNWYTSSSATTAFASTLSGVSTGVLTSDVTYYVSRYNTIAKCEGPRKAFVIDVADPIRPVVNAGPDQTIYLPENKVSLSGSATDGDGTISRYSWGWMSGPSGPAFGSSGSAATTVSNLVEGVYKFRLTATDNHGLTGFDEVLVTVKDPRKLYNYVEETIVLVPGKKSFSEVNPLSVDEKTVNLTYIDGLGRPMQQVNWQGSPQKFDVVKPVVYDAFGREEKQYLPFVPAEKHGGFKHTSKIIDAAGNYTGIAQGFYAAGSNNKIADDTKPFAQTVFEASPLNRVLKQGSPGEAWQPVLNSTTDRTVKIARRTNVATDKVLLWNYTNGAGNVFGTISTNGFYSYDPAQLDIEETRDEHNQLVTQFTNLQGQVVLKEVTGTGGAKLRTYYVYDDLGNLRVVLPPKFSQTLTGTAYTYNAAQLDELCFWYHYDKRNRMVEKHVPGSGVNYMVYDRWDRLVLTQDARQRANTEAGVVKKQWTYTKYDHLDRPVVTGEWTDNRERAALETDVMGFTGRSEDRNLSEFHGYTLTNTFPNQNVDHRKVLTIFYYDDYDFKFSKSDYRTILKDPYGNFGYSHQKGFEGNTLSSRTKGQLTGSKTKVLGLATGDHKWLNSANYYDDKGRLIQNINSNLYGGIDRVTNAYDFTGKVTKSLQHHYGAEQLMILKEFEYDHAGRLLNTFQTIEEYINENSINRVLLAANEYNELGELVDKKLHVEGNSVPAGSPVTETLSNTIASGETFTATATESITLTNGFTAAAGSSFSAVVGSVTALQSVDYRYNIRGWLTHINNAALNVNAATNDEADDVFGFELKYNTTTETGVAGWFNGNIAEVVWNSSRQKERQAYGYTYDPLNRLTAATYKNFTTTTKNDRYSVPSVTYDVNGNIEKLQRRGLVSGGGYNLMDNLSYFYKGNQLMAVNDAVLTRDAGAGDFFDNGKTTGSITSPEYGYDANGNLISDLNKGITGIKYNYLNLPEEITFSSTKKIQYIYSAAGEKLRKVATDGTAKTSDYIGGIHYEENVLKFFQHEEGRVLKETSGFAYQYDLKDHLGNARVSFDKDPATGKVRVIQEDHYYPYGMTQAGNGYVSGFKNKYMYNGKELQEDLGLGWYHYGARYYDPALGRWHVVDAASEIYYGWTPYKYGLNNPILFNDPDGNCETCLDFLANTAAAIVETANGFANAVSSNNTTIPSVTGGTVSIVDRQNSSSQSYQIGQAAGDAFSVVQGAAEAVIGAVVATGGAAGGVVTAPSGVGAVAGGAVAAGGVAIATHGANTAMNAVENLFSNKGTVNAEGKPGNYAPNKPLSKKAHGEPMADPEATGPHTQIGTKEGRKGNYTQAREFDGNGNPVKDIDFTDHGRPSNHPDPHQHNWLPSPTGGTPQRSKEAIPLLPQN